MTEIDDELLSKIWEDADFLNENNDDENDDDKKKKDENMSDTIQKCKHEFDNNYVMLSMRI